MFTVTLDFGAGVFAGADGEDGASAGYPGTVGSVGRMDAAQFLVRVFPRRQNE